MKFLSKLFGKKQSTGRSKSYTPYTQSDADIIGVWIHQEPGGSTFYHDFYYADKELQFDTFEVTHSNKLGVSFKASDIKWNGKTLKATQVTHTGFKIQTQLRIRGDLLEGTVKVGDGNPGKMALRKLPNEIAEKEIANLKEIGAQLGSE